MPSLQLGYKAITYRQSVCAVLARHAGLAVHVHGAKVAVVPRGGRAGPTTRGIGQTLHISVRSHGAGQTLLAPVQVGVVSASGAAGTGGCHASGGATESGARSALVRAERRRHGPAAIPGPLNTRYGQAGSTFQSFLLHPMIHTVRFAGPPPFHRAASGPQGEKRGPVHRKWNESRRRRDGH